jgi:hypothetical protein
VKVVTRAQLFLPNFVLQRFVLQPPLVLVLVLATVMMRAMMLAAGAAAADGPRHVRWTSKERLELSQKDRWRVLKGPAPRKSRRILVSVFKPMATMMTTSVMTTLTMMMMTSAEAATAACLLPTRCSQTAATRTMARVTVRTAP